MNGREKKSCCHTGVSWMFWSLSGDLASLLLKNMEGWNDWSQRSRAFWQTLHLIKYQRRISSPFCYYLSYLLAVGYGGYFNTLQKFQEFLNLFSVQFCYLLALGRLLACSWPQAHAGCLVCFRTTAIPFLTCVTGSRFGYQLATCCACPGLWKN